MKIVPRSVPRWPRIPVGIIGFVALWALVVALARLYSHYTGSTLDACLFHRFTGYSCPTCGTTRGLLAMARGAFAESFAWNPVTMSGAVLGSVWLAGRAITAKTLEVRCSPLEKRLLVLLGLAIMGLNWAWLIYSHP